MQSSPFLVLDLSNKRVYHLLVFVNGMQDSVSPRPVPTYAFGSTHLSHSRLPILFQAVVDDSFARINVELHWAAYKPDAEELSPAGMD